MVHVLSDRCWFVAGCSYSTTQFNIAFLYIAPLLCYTQLPYLIQIMYVFIAVSGTSLCTCAWEIMPSVLHDSVYSCTSIAYWLALFIL